VAATPPPYPCKAATKVRPTWHANPPEGCVQVCGDHPALPALVTTQPYQPCIHCTTLSALPSPEGCVEVCGDQGIQHSITQELQALQGGRPS